MKITERQMQDILAAHDLVDRCAIDDAENYDGGYILGCIADATKAVNEAICCSDKQVAE